MLHSHPKKEGHKITITKVIEKVYKHVGAIIKREDNISKENSTVCTQFIVLNISLMISYSMC